MIVLDTDVVSALMQEEPDQAVANWLDRQPLEAFWITRAG
jgi:predicted nucleic acid-binding protein